MGISLILLGIVIVMVKSQQYTNMPINSPSGIYFEGVNKVRMIKGEWNILTSLNIGDIHRHAEPLTLVLSNYSELCHKIIFECRPFYLKTHQWDLADKDIELQWKEIEDFVQPIRSTKTKYDSSEMTKEERDFLDNALPYVSSLKHTDLDRQTTHIPSGLKSVVEMIDTRKRQIKKEIKELSEKTKLAPTEARNMFSGIAETVENIIQLRVQLYNAIIEVITSIKSGQLHPSTFIPEELRKTFEMISEQRQDAMLPLLQTELGLTMIQDVTKTRLLVKENVIVIVITIPFIDKKDSILYLTHPHPVVQNIGHETKIFAQIDGTSKYLIFNNFTREYALPSITYPTESCKANSQYLICDPTLIFYTINNNSHCEMGLLHNTIPKNCDIRLSSCNEDKWTALTKTSGWLYSLIKPMEGQLICEHHPVLKIALARNGRLIIKKGCRFTFNNITLTTTNITTINTIPVAIIPNQTLILKEIYPEINYYEKLFQFNEQSGLTDKIPLTYILRTITHKLYYDHKTFTIIESEWNWKTIILIFLVINCLIYLMQLINCIRYHDNSNNLASPEESSPLTNPTLLVGHHVYNVSEEPYYKIPTSLPIPIPTLTFQGPNTLPNV